MDARTAVPQVLALTLALSACAPSAEETGDVEQDSVSATSAGARAAVEQLITDFDAATAAGDVDALMATYTDDPVALPPGAPAARGRAEVRDLWRGLLARGDVTTENVGRGTWVSGDLAGTWGTYTLTIRPEEGGTIEETGKFMFLARRQADGSWKSVANIWNSDSAELPAGS